MAQVVTTSNDTRSERSVGEEGYVLRSDYLLLLSVLALLTIGLLMVYSSTYALGYINYDDAAWYLRRQGMWALLGLASMLIVWRIDYRLWQRFSVPLMGVTILMLVLLLIFGRPGLGAQRWLLGRSVQPAELAKLTVVLYIAHWASSKGDRIRQLDAGLIPFGVIVGTICGLILLQPDYSTAILIAVTAAVMFFIAGADLAQFVIGGLIAMTTLVTIATRAEYRMDRIEAFLNPFEQSSSTGYQITQTLIALASGGVLGQGLGSSRGDLGVLPLGHSDSIFAILGQELGLVMGLVVLGLYLFFGYRGFRIGANAADGFGTVLACGITCWILLQAIMNVAVVTNTIPFTGIPLPFISVGGSSLVVGLTGVGFLLSVSRGE